MKNMLFLGLGVVGVLVIIMMLSSQPETVVPANTINQQAANSQPTKNAPIKQDAEVKAAQTESSNYIEYTSNALSDAQKNGKSVLFFKASWCPTCTEADKEFKENLTKIPTGVTILKADFDKEKELKNKYNVVMQDTFIQVDADGNVVSQWNSGGEGLKSLLANIQ